MKGHPIETAPLDTPILIYGKWFWNTEDDEKAETRWLVGTGYFAERYNAVWWYSVTQNPYQDRCLNPIAWAPLPSTPEQEANGANSQDPVQNAKAK